MNPTYHPEARGLAFNVKTLRFHWPEGGTPWQRDSAWEQAQRLWWSDARQAAQRHGFTDVCQVGRSGGWLAPLPAIHPEETHEFDRLSAFGDALGEMMGTIDDRFTAELDEVIAGDFAEGERLSACEAQLAERMRTERVLIGAVREYVRAGHDLNIYRAIEAALTAYDEARA